MLEAPIDAAVASDGQSEGDGASDGAENKPQAEQSEPRGPRREPMFEQAQDEPLVRREREPREERASERERNGREDEHGDIAGQVVALDGDERANAISI